MHASLKEVFAPYICCRRKPRTKRRRPNRRLAQHSMASTAAWHSPQVLQATPQLSFGHVQPADSRLFFFVEGAPQPRMRLKPADVPVVTSVYACGLPADIAMAELERFFSPVSPFDARCTLLPCYPHHLSS